MQRGLFALSVLVSSLASTAWSLQCPSQPRHLTDQGAGYPTAVPPLVASVQVSSSLSDYPKEELLAFRLPLNTNCWCGTAIPANITINFTEPLVIYGLLSGGYYAGHVNSFSLEYSLSDSSAVESLTEVFNVPNPVEDVPLVLLPQSIVATSLHLLALTRETFTCWTLALIGCTLKEAQREQPSSPTPSTAIPSPSQSSNPATDSPKTTPEPATDTPTTIVEQRGGSSEAVGIAVSTAVVTVLAVTAVVAVGVGLCWAISSGRIFAQHKYNKRRSGIEDREMTLRRVENELYTMQRSSNGEGQTSTLQISGSREGLLSSDELTSTLSTNASHTATEYHQSGVYEPVQPVGEAVAAESLVDNAAYRLTSVPPSDDHPLNENTGYEPVLSPTNDSADTNLEPSVRYVTTNDKK